MLTPDKTTFRRAQTDSPGSLEVFFSIDSTDALGRPVDGPWGSVSVEFTEQEQSVIAGIVARARQAYCDKINA